jgi:DNA-binding IclR family transcriptional regulator
MPDTKSQHGVQAIERGCRILDLLGREKQNLSIGDISHALNLPKPTVHRILATLCSMGYTTQDDVSKNYRLDFHLVELGQSVLDRINIRKESRPFLRELADRVQETVHLAILDNADILYLDKVERISHPVALRMASRIGMRNYAHSCALGKVLLAFLSDKERNEILAKKGLPKRTKNTIVDLKELTEHLAIIKSQGYTVDNEENEDGIRCVAAPIRNYRGEVIAGISISGPAVRITKERINRQLKHQVMEAAAKITQKLGYAEPTRKGGDDT